MPHVPYLEYLRRNQHVLNRYLRDVLPKRKDLEQVIGLITQVIVPISDWDDDLPRHNKPLGESTAVNPGFTSMVGRCLQLFLPSGPPIIYGLLGYEAICWHENIYMNNPLPEVILARIVEHYAPKSYEAVEYMLQNALDPVTIKYAQQLGIEDHCRDRTRVELLHMLYRLAAPPDVRWWSGATEKVSLWAEGKIKSLPALFKDNFALASEVELHIATLETKKAQRRQ